MKFIYLFLSFLICSSSLLDTVRKEIIDIALLYLPKRANVNFLKMVNEMLKAKIKFSMNKVESAYFIYKWIAQNIEYNCNYNIEEDGPAEISLAYKEGKGGTIGITGLFILIFVLGIFPFIFILFIKYLFLSNISDLLWIIL